MKKQLVVILATAASAVALGGAASAADLPAYTKAPAAPATAAYDWSGVYIGGHVGGGWSTTGFQDPTAGTAVEDTVDDDFNAGGVSGRNANASGFLGGGQVGWMYQVARLVVGGDLDFSKTSLTGTGSGALVPFTGEAAFASATEAYSVHTDWTATATATIGLARGEWLVYSKGGAAWAQTSYNVSIAGNDRGAFGFSAPGTSDTRVGWTVGVGVKWAFWNNWFANIEYDYLDFGSKAQGFTGPAAFAGSTFTQNVTLTPIFNEHISELKFGINYKFPADSLFW